MLSLRFTMSLALCLALQPISAYAIWDYSLAAQLAMHDGLRTTCGAIEPRLSTILNDEWKQITQSNELKAINAARKTQEYKNIYRQVLHEDLKNSWNDPEEKDHICEALYAQHSNKSIGADHWWWRDRPCAGVSLDSKDGNHCAVGPYAFVSFGNTIPDKRISILSIVPSSDVSFPRAGTFVQQSDLPDTVVSNTYVSGTWSIPDSIEFEWKEWPSAFPSESNNDQELKSIRYYVEEVRAKVQRKHAKIDVRNHIPNHVIAALLGAERTVQPASPNEQNMKLFFIFMKDGLRVRWEQWHGQCIEKYGGDTIDVPRDQLLSGARVCNDSTP